MNFRVIDDEGKMLDYGRDLKKLQGKYTQTAGESFDQLAADELNYTGCIQWAFDDLPETWQFMQKGQAFVGYPAIVDEGDAVGVRIFDTEQKAARQHQAGLMRLFQLYLRKECTYVVKNLPKSAAAELTYNQLPKHPIIETDAAASYKDDMLYLILYTVFVEGKTIRTQPAFEQSLKQHKGELVGFANEAGRIILEIMELHGAVKAQLKRFNVNDPMVQDINEQLKFMIYEGFVRHTPFQQLKAMPRYLRAILYRIDKLDNSMQKMQEINRYWTRYWKDVEKKTKKEPVIPEQDNYRWMLEEFRVSLFAQQLKTAYPISAKRMEKAWDERG